MMRCESSLTRVGCPASRLPPGPFPLTRVRNQVTGHAVAVGVTQPALLSKAPAEDAPGQGFSEPLPRATQQLPAVLGSSSPRERLESPKHFLLRQHIPRGRKGRGAGAVLVSAPAPSTAVSCRSFLWLLPSLCKVQPKPGTSGGPAHRPLTHSVPPAPAATSDHFSRG